VARRRRGKAESHPPEMDERWAVSYLDMMTVLFLTFVVLFSMSSIDAGKYEELKNALSKGFGQEESELDDRQSGLSAMESGTQAAAADQKAGEPAEPQTAEEKLADIQAGVQQNLAATGQEAAVEFTRVDGALVIRILSGETMFTPDDARLSDSATQLLAGITPVIRQEGGSVVVEGHADYVQPLNYETNWELSADRAVQVVRHMVDAQGMDPRLVSATGFGSARPIEGQRDMLDRNRRVDIVVETQDDAGSGGEATGET
jgi:chemotaxis protein MotB